MSKSQAAQVVSIWDPRQLDIFDPATIERVLTPVSTRNDVPPVQECQGCAREIAEVRHHDGISTLVCVHCFNRLEASQDALEPWEVEDLDEWQSQQADDELEDYERLVEANQDWEDWNDDARWEGYAH